MKTLVVDSNVWVSAFLFGGRPKVAIRHALKHDQIFMTLECLEETYKTLQKPKFRGRLHKMGQTPESITANIIQSVYFIEAVPISINREPMPRDSDDLVVLACAHAAVTEIIITGDKDLLALHPHPNFQILTPEQYLKQETP